MAKTVDVDSASGNIGRHENAGLSASESGKNLFALPLRNISVQSRDIVSALVKHFRHIVGIIFGLSKDKPVEIRRHIDNSDKCLDFVALAHEPIFLVNQKRLFNETQTS